MKMKVLLSCISLLFGLFVLCNGLTDDEIAAFKVRKFTNINTGVQGEVKIQVNDENTLLLTSNGVPDHPAGKFNGSRGSPNFIEKQELVYIIPRRAEVRTDGETGCLPMGPIGLAINGVPIYNPYTLTCCDAGTAELNLFDECWGHPSPNNAYHYHTAPLCLFKNRCGQASGIVGVALDGFPIYGPFDENGVELTSADLDECNGKMTRDGQYRYHVTGDFPYFLNCFKGSVIAQTNIRTNCKCTQPKFPCDELNHHHQTESDQVPSNKTINEQLGLKKDGHFYCCEEDDEDQCSFTTNTNTLIETATEDVTKTTSNNNDNNNNNNNMHYLALGLLSHHGFTTGAGGDSDNKPPPSSSGSDQPKAKNNQGSLLGGSLSLSAGSAAAGVTLGVQRRPETSSQQQPQGSSQTKPNGDNSNRGGTSKPGNSGNHNKPKQSETKTFSFSIHRTFAFRYPNNNNQGDQSATRPTPTPARPTSSSPSRGRDPRPGSQQTGGGGLLSAGRFPFSGNFFGHRIPNNNNHGQGGRQTGGARPNNNNLWNSLFGNRQPKPSSSGSRPNSFGFGFSPPGGSSSVGRNSQQRGTEANRVKPTPQGRTRPPKQPYRIGGIRISSGPMRFSNNRPRVVFRNRG